jgi:hypothetical protein
MDANPIDPNRFHHYERVELEGKSIVVDEPFVRALGRETIASGVVDRKTGRIVEKVPPVPHRALIRL